MTGVDVAAVEQRIRGVVFSRRIRLKDMCAAGSSRVKTWVDLVDRPVSGTLAVVILGVIMVVLVSQIVEHRRRNSGPNKRGRKAPSA